MMPTDPAAGRAAQILQHWNAGTLQPSWQWNVERAYDDVGVLLAVLRAAETERDQAQADADALLAELAEARSDAKKQVARVAHQWAESQAQLAAAEARAARLAALEAAAVAWAAIFTAGPAQEPWFSPWQALHDAVANLNATES